MCLIVTFVAVSAWIVALYILANSVASVIVQAESQFRWLLRYLDRQVMHQRYAYEIKPLKLLIPSTPAV